MLWNCYICFLADLVITARLLLNFISLKQIGSVMDKRLADYIETEGKKGFSKEQIRKTLTWAGYKPELVDEHLKTSHRVLYMIVGIIILSLSGYAIYYAMLDPVTKGRNALNNDNFEKAIAYYEEAIETDKASATWGLGETYFRMGDFEKASSYLGEAVQYRNDSHLLFSYGMSLYYLEDYEKAEYYLNLTDETFVELQFALVTLDYRAGKYDAAMEKLRAIKAQNPEIDCVSLAILGIYDLKIGNAEEGNKLLEQARKDSVCNVLKI